MGKIILVRHGEVDIKQVDKIDGLEIEEFLNSYNLADIKSSSKPPQKLIDHANSCDIIICSNLNRSLSSAKALNKTPHIIDKLFQEANPPYIKTKLLKLSPKNWLIISRILWLVGYSKHGESLKDTKKRAFQASQMLIKLSQNKNIMLIGHALFNIFIAKELRKAGFKGAKIPAKEFWEYGIYCKNGLKTNKYYNK